MDWFQTIFLNHDLQIFTLKASKKASRPNIKLIRCIYIDDSEVSLYHFDCFVFPEKLLDSF